jgi:hypothetical protein
MTKLQSRPISVYALIVLIIFQGLSGIAGGIGLVGDPTGESLQIPIEWLERSPFINYRIPGWILLIILGVFPMITFFGLIRRLRWSWFASFIVAIGLIIWISVEIIVIGYQHEPPLQLIYGTVGVLLLLITLLPTVRKYFGVK